MNNDSKAALLRGLGRLGLLIPAFRLSERVRSIGARTVGAGSDGLPLPPPKLRARVGDVDAASFLEVGRLVEESIRGALGRAGAPIGSFEAILDFGCGCGRVLRRWRDLHARVYGSDLNAPAVDWCRRYLPFAEVHVNSLEPPLTYADASFDFVYALSVFTHLPVKLQLAWRDELRRVLRPGGYLLLTFHGDAYAERLRADERRVYTDGECVVRWPDAVGSNLCTTFHPLAFVRDRLADGWAFVEHVPEGILGQDLVLLRRPAS